MITKIIIRNISWQTLYEILSGILGFIFYIVLARTLGQEIFGLYNYIFSFLSIVVLFFDMGISPNYLRKWSVNTTNLVKDIKHILSAKILIFILITICLVPYVILVNKQFIIEFLLFYIYFSLEIVRQIPIIYANSQNNFNRSFFINSIERIFSIGVGIIALMLGYSLTTLLILFIIGRLISILSSLSLVRTFYLPTFNISIVKPILITSFPLLIIGAFSTIYFRIDIVIVGYILGIREVGLYASSYRIFEALLIIPTLINTAILPVIIKCYHQNKIEKLISIFQIITRHLNIISIFIAVFFTAYSEQIIKLLYGFYDQSSYTVLIILGWTGFFIFLNVLYQGLLFANHQEKYLAKLYIFLTITNIILNLIMIPLLGIIGSAITTLVCEIIILIMSIKKSQVNISLKSVIFILTIAVVAIFTTHYLHLPLLITLLFSGAIYLTILTISKILNINYLYSLTANK